MHIKRVINYKKAWESLIEDHPDEFDDLVRAISNLTPEIILDSEPRGPIYKNEQGITEWKLRGCWEDSIENDYWRPCRDTLTTESTKALNLFALGHHKEHVSLILLRHREVLNRWLFNAVPLSYKMSLIDLPVAVVLSSDTDEELFDRRRPMGIFFDRVKEELSALAPLSHGSPFVIVEISLKPDDFELIEIEAEGISAERNIVINRSIEFPPEYHQAGLGILSYFGTVLRENYPDEHATVKIEQEGLTVRMIVTSLNGDRSVIEKALEQYEMVVRGESKADELFESKLLVIELKSELRIAQMRIEQQRELMEHKNLEIMSLQQIIGHALTNKQPISLDLNVSPVIHISNSQEQIINIKNYIIDITDSISDILPCLIFDPEIELRAMDLSESLSTISSKDSPKEIKESNALKKLRSFIEEAANTGSSINKLIKQTSTGIETMQKLGKKYNKIAQWCGAPTIPDIFISE